MATMFRGFLKDEDGATMVEYGLMVGLIAVVCILVIAALGQSIGGAFDEANTAVVDVGTNQVTVTGGTP